MKAKFKPVVDTLTKARIPLWIAQSRTRSLNALRIRAMIVELLYRNEELTQAEISELIKHSQPAISRLRDYHKKLFAQDAQYREEFQLVVREYRKVQENGL